MSTAGCYSLPGLNHAQLSKLYKCQTTGVPTTCAISAVGLLFIIYVVGWFHHAFGKVQELVEAILQFLVYPGGRHAICFSKFFGHYYIKNAETAKRIFKSLHFNIAVLCTTVDG